MKYCLIFAAGEYPETVAEFNDFLDDEDKEEYKPYIIACDKGYEMAVSLGYTPDLVIGDFDSLGYVPEGVEVEVHPRKKDETDLELAIERGIAEGCDYFTVYGALGGRLDHSMANINIAARLAGMKKACLLLGKNESATVVKNGSLELFNEKKGTRFSVFPWERAAKLVTIIGAEYPLLRATLKKNQILGVSNEMDGRNTVIIVGDGMLLVVMEITDTNNINIDLD